MRYSPFERGEIFTVKQHNVDRVASMVRPSLRMGHSVQFEHDDAYAAKGMVCHPSAPMAGYDRDCVLHLHEDKTAGFVQNKNTGEISLNALHYITQAEYILFENERKNADRDVIIHCLGLVKPFEDGVPFDAVCFGAVSWWNIRMFLTSTEKGYSFHRESALRWSPYVNS